MKLTDRQLDLPPRDATATDSGGKPGGFFGFVFVLFVLFVPLALDKGWPGDERRSNSPKRLWRVVLDFLLLCLLVSFVAFGSVRVELASVTLEVSRS